MGSETISQRSNSQTIDSEWFNIFRKAFAANIVPRNSSGVATTGAGDLGTSSLLWGSAFISALKMAANGKLITITAPATLAADYAVELPGALPAAQRLMSLDNAGLLKAIVDGDNSTIELVSNALQIKDLGVTAAKLAADAVTTAKILNANVTLAKLAALNESVSSSCGNASTSSTSFSDVTNLSVSITTTGRPVEISLIPDGSGPGSDAYIQSGENSAQVGVIALNRGGSDIESVRVGSNPVLYVSPGSIWFRDAPAAGTYTYKLRFKVETGSVTLVVKNCKLWVRER